MKLFARLSALAVCILASTAEGETTPQMCRRVAGEVFSSDGALQLQILGVDPNWSAARIVSVLTPNYDPYDTKQNILPWLLLMSPEENHTMAAHGLQRMQLARYLSDVGVRDSIEKVLTDAAAERVEYSQQALADHSAMITNINSQPLLDPKKEPYAPMIDGACKVLAVRRCKETFVRTMILMSARPYGGAWMSAPQLIDEIFSDPRYRQGLARAAITVQAKIAGLNAHPNPEAGSLGNIFDDIRESFESLGFARGAASEMTIKYLGLYATRGASVSMHRFLTNKESYAVQAAHFILSSGMTVLDNYLQGRGLGGYSYAPSTSSSCSYGRPYHYWMAAYLVWQLIHEGYPARTAMLATHLLSTGYESFIRAWGKHISSAFVNDPANYYTVNVQLNIATTDLGAYWGASLAGIRQPNGRMNIDRALHAMGERAHGFNGDAWELSNILSDPQRTYLWARYLTGWDALMLPLVPNRIPGMDVDAMSN